MVHFIVIALLMSAWIPGSSGESEAQPGFSITQGIGHHQVVQRDRNNSVDLLVAGRAPSDLEAAVYVSVSDRGVPLKGFQDLPTGTARRGAWQAEIEDLPVGGPYRIDFWIGGKEGTGVLGASVLDVLVGDLWLLAGQSNMQGVGVLAAVEEPSTRVHALDLADRWRIAREPLHEMWEAVDPVYWAKSARSAGLGPSPSGEELRKRAEERRRTRRRGAGLGLSFAREVAREADVPVGLIPCALGGSSISEWDPDLKEQGGASLYGALLRRSRAAGGRVRGILWYQGEADARPPETVPLYPARLKRLIQALRHDLGDYDLPFYFVQLGRMLEWTYYGSQGRMAPPRIAEQFAAFRHNQALLNRQMPHTGMVAALDLSLDDAIHIATPDLKRLGRRLAHLALMDLYGRRDREPGPQLASIRVVEDPNPKDHKLFVRYRGVNGRLRAAGRISGFSLHREDGSEVRAIYDAYMDPDRRDTVVLRYQQSLPPGTGLAYGWGTDPYCNLVDERDMAAPGFGPIRLDTLPDFANRNDGDVFQ